jgi:hypothetical protein
MLVNFFPQEFEQCLLSGNNVVENHEIEDGVKKSHQQTRDISLEGGLRCKGKRTSYEMVY